MKATIASVGTLLKEHLFTPIAGFTLDQAISTLPVVVDQLRQMMATLSVGIICLVVVFRGCIPQCGPHSLDNNTQIVPTHRELTA